MCAALAHKAGLDEKEALSTMEPLADQTTKNSILQIDLKAPSGAVWADVDWFKQGRLGRNLEKVKGNRLRSAIYLRFGKGSYRGKVTYYKWDKSQIGEPIRFQIMNTDDVDKEFLLSSHLVNSEDPAIKRLAKEINRGVKTDMEKARAIHNWVCTNIKYDYALMKSLFELNKSLDSQEEKMKKYMKLQERARATNVLLKKSAVCQGYADLTAALFRASGIPCKLIDGRAINPEQLGGFRAEDFLNSFHAWNEVRIEDRWVIMDTTWDAGYLKQDGTFVFKKSWNYFDPKEETFYLDHAVNCTRTEYTGNVLRWSAFLILGEHRL